VLSLTRVDHVSFATPSIDDSLRWFEAVFGAQLVHRQSVPSEGYTFAELAIPNAQIRFELIEPLGEDSFVARFLRQRGPGFHHLTVRVRDVDQAAAELRRQGIEPWGGVRGTDGWRQTFLHPRDAGGILIQIVADDAAGEE
jgi:methylmalonyl-CoA/ethylmalonyl-CoA epimerase